MEIKYPPNVSGSTSIIQQTRIISAGLSLNKISLAVASTMIVNQNFANATVKEKINATSHRPRQQKPFKPNKVSKLRK